MSDKPDLSAAYAVQSKEDVTSLYKSWADTYDADFIEAQGYQMPREIAEAFVALHGRGPVLDVGAGTGSVGQALVARGVDLIDGLDLSSDMLRVAERKKVYRTLMQGDITQPLGDIGPYKGIVSAGTFTFGHVGPDGLDALLAVAERGCFFAIGINAAHFESAGFAAKLAGLDGQIEGLTTFEVRIYDDRADEGHRNDMAKIVTFKLA